MISIQFKFLNQTLCVVILALKPLLTAVETQSTDFVEQLEGVQQVFDSWVVSCKEAIFEHEDQCVFEHQDVLH